MSSKPFPSVSSFFQTLKKIITH